MLFIYDDGRRRFDAFHFVKFVHQRANPEGHGMCTHVLPEIKDGFPTLVSGVHPS